VIVPAHDAARTLPRTMAALNAQELEGAFEVIVVDDGSRDDTAEVAARAGARLIRNERPLGPGASRNAGAAAARSRCLAFTDADCAPTPGWLAAGLGALDTADLVQGRVEPRPGVTAGPLDRTLWVTGPVGLFESANLFVRREVFARLGGFDDGLLELVGAHFGEDVVFGWRAHRAGVPTSFCEEALVYHEVFRRGPGEFLREKRRLAYFCELVRRVPELRGTFLYRRWFMTRRSALFAAAAGGSVIAVVARSPLPAVAALPYSLLLAREAGTYGKRAALVLGAGDAVGFAVLASGSLRFRRLVL